MHLFDENEKEEKALCGADAPAVGRRSVKGYLEDRLNRAGVGNVCQECKTLAVPLAEAILEDMAQHLEDEGRFGDAEDSRALVNRLARETGLDHGRG